MTPKQATDATAWLQTMPRSVRKAFRIPVRKQSSNSIAHGDVGCYMKTESRTDPDLCHAANFQDPDMDIYSHAEFADIDYDHTDLTIVEPDEEVELWNFCTGYDVF